MEEMTVDQAVRMAFELHRQGRLEEAAEVYEQVVAQAPRAAHALHLLGIVRQQRGRQAEAVELFRRAVAADPAQSEFYYNLGNSLLAVGQNAEAEAAYARAVELLPTFAAAWNNLGHMRMLARRPRAGAEAYGRAVQSQPALAEAHNGLSVALKDLGRTEEAIAAAREAVRRKPAYADAHSNLVYTLHFSPSYDAETILAEHVAWSRRHADPLTDAAPPPPVTDRDPGRRLRVGYVSPDFREHPVGLSMLPILPNHDRAAVESVCLSDAAAPDHVTEKLRAHADEWHETAALSDAQFAEFVRSKRIDVLVDLTMHMNGNRLLSFARRLAPVQASFLAYPATAGLRAIEYRITDPVLDPPGETERFNSETLVRLPHSFWCYPGAGAGDGDGNEPPVRELPALRNGYVTFGSLNNPCKVTPPTIALWARVLSAVPSSRLMLLSFDEEPAKNVHVEQLARHGIGLERIGLVGRQARAAYLRTYDRMDLVLDPLPYNGHFTSCDALYMGAAVISLHGRTSVGRAGQSLLTAVGLADELLARSEEEFVAIAVRWASDLPRLAALRGGLRGRMKASPLMDARGFVRGLEQAYRAMWRRWCGPA
jgi:predicted O-linked N-acetylglucosamine transferase (SPINDLY family)